jgi:hypothetical protein
MHALGPRIGRVEVEGDVVRESGGPAEVNRGGGGPAVLGDDTRIVVEGQPVADPDDAEDGVLRIGTTALDPGDVIATARSRGHRRAGERAAAWASPDTARRAEPRHNDRDERESMSGCDTACHLGPKPARAHKRNLQV